MTNFKEVFTFIILMLLFQAVLTSHKHASSPGRDGDLDRVTDLETLTEEELSSLYEDFQSPGGAQSDIPRDVYRTLVDGEDGYISDLDENQHNSDSDLKSLANSRALEDDNANAGEDKPNSKRSGHEHLNVTNKGVVGNHGNAHIGINNKREHTATGRASNTVNNHVDHMQNQFDESLKQKGHTANANHKGTVQEHDQYESHGNSATAHGKILTGIKNSKYITKHPSQHVTDEHQPNLEHHYNNFKMKPALIKHKEGSSNEDNDFDAALDREMQNMASETHKDFTNGGTAIDINKHNAPKGKSVVVYRISNAEQGGTRPYIRRRKLMKALRVLCSNYLSMCDIRTPNTVNEVSNKDTDKYREENEDDATEEDYEKSSDRESKKTKARKGILKLLMLLNAKAHVTVSTNAPSSGIPTKKFHEPIVGARTSSGDTSADSVIAPPVNTPAYADKAVWIGIGVGTGTAWLMMLLLYGCYRCLLSYKSERQNNQLKQLCRKDAEDSPMHIRMAKMSKDKNGNHYVVSILDDKKGEEEDEEGWSSEEEVYNVSGTRGSPRITSTPIKTPTKTNTLP